MNPLLLSGFGTSINVDKRRLVINNNLKEERIELYPHQVDYDSIIIDGHTGNISFEAIRWLTKHDIPIIMLNWNGNLLATVNPKEPSSGKLRINQYAKYLDDKARYDIALKMVKEKVSKSLSLLSQLSKYYEEIDLSKVEEAFADEYTNYLVSSKKATSDKYNFNKLLTYEGKIAIIYWDYLLKVFNKLYPGFNFKGRRNKSYSWNMNASDEINALLNYGYAILESQVRKCINSVGLDPCVGYLHEPTHSKTPLVYDLQEIYRWIIDLSVLQLLELKKLKKSDFTVTENYNIRLKEHTAKMLIERIKINFNSKAKYKKKNYAYDTLLQDNVQLLANFIQDKTTEFKFDIPNIEIMRDDDVEMRDFLVNMTREQRKQLGINKSTLWYMRKNLREGKKINIYDKVKAKLRRPEEIG